MSPWTSFLAHLRVGRPIVVPSCGVTLVPIVDADPRPLDVFPLRWGIEHGHTRVTEVGEGRVDRVRVEHAGATPILVLDGEEVVGAKQNRIFNASFLVPPRSPVELPVSCVERDRWRHTSRQFSSSSRTVITSVRRTKLERVATSVVTRGEYDASQREVWRSVDGYLERTRVTSRTSAYSDAADTRIQRINATLDDIALSAGQVGFAAVTSSGDVALDAFGSPGLFNRAWRVVARGMLGEGGEGQPPDECEDVVRDLLAQLRDSEPKSQSAPGLGDSIFAVGGRCAAGAIAYDGRVYHLLATCTR